MPAERYSPAAPAQLLLRQGRERALLALLRAEDALPLGERRILEVGCGAGQWLADFETWGARRERLAGIDLVPDRVAAAAARLPGADLRVGDAADLPWEAGAFDIVLQSTVFSSILDHGMRRAVAAAMARALAPGGVIVWHDFFLDNPRNRAVRGIRRREIAALFPGFSMRRRRVSLAAPLARVVATRSMTAAMALDGLRLLDTHHLATLRRS